MNQHEWGPEAGGPAETGRQQWSGWGPQSRGPPPGGLPHFPQFSRLSGGSVLGRRPAVGLRGVWGWAGHPSGLSTWLAPEGSSGRQVGLLGWPGLVVGRAPSEGELSVGKSPRVSRRGRRPAASASLRGSQKCRFPAAGPASQELWDGPCALWTRPPGPLIDPRGESLSKKSLGGMNQGKKWEYAGGRGAGCVDRARSGPGDAWTSRSQRGGAHTH